MELLSNAQWVSAGKPRAEAKDHSVDTRLFDKDSLRHVWHDKTWCARQIFLGLNAHELDNVSCQAKWYLFLVIVSSTLVTKAKSVNKSKIGECVHMIGQLMPFWRTMERTGRRCGSRWRPAGSAYSSTYSLCSRHDVCQAAILRTSMAPMTLCAGALDWKACLCNVAVSGHHCHVVFENFLSPQLTDVVKFVCVKMQIYKNALLLKVYENVAFVQYSFPVQLAHNRPFSLRALVSLVFIRTSVQ